MKNLKISIFLILWVISHELLTAQTQSKYGFELREYLKTTAPNSQVPLLIEGDSNHMNSIVEHYGGRIRLQVNNLFSLEIPAKNVESFSQEEAVSLIEFSTTPGRTLSDTMLIHTNVDSIVQQAFPLRTQYTGKGVILGVIDSGIELAHPDFQDSTGKTRVLYVWDQKQAFDPARQALQYNYGIEWDSASINAGISTHDDRAAEFGHGSNVTGAAASNGLASGQFRGVAPKASIISIATDFNKPNWLQTVAESVDYIYKKADALGMPCVINASVGTYVGSHDGKDISARIIDALIQQKAGRAFVCAAGNAGNQKFHVQQKPINDTAFTWFENAPSQWSGQGGFYYEVWSDTADFRNLQFSIGTDKELNGVFTFKGRTAFSGIQSRLNVIYDDTIRDVNGNQIAIVNTYAEQSQGRYKLEIAIINPDSSDFLYRFETKGTGKIDIYSSFNLFRHNEIKNTSLPSVSQFPDMVHYVRPDSMQTMVSSFTCLPAAITVGNHYNRSTYTDVSGTFRTFNHTPGQISVTSSLGPNRTNYLKPDVSSAGDIMFGTGRLATIASAISSNPAKVSSDSLHWRNGGTSMASPTVAGMVALYLQLCPKADNNQIKNDLLSSAKKDQFTGTQNNFTYGNGKADGFQFLKKRIFFPTIPLASPNFCVGEQVMLVISPSFSSYQWNTNSADTTNSITVSQDGNYFAWVEDQFGCSVVSEVASLVFNPLPQQPILQQNGLTLSINNVGMYQWYHNQTSIAWANNPSHIALLSGDYYCEYTDSNGCSTNSDTISMLVTSLDQNPLQTFNILPNPSKGEFVVKLSSKQLVDKLEVFNPQGKLVWSKNIHESRQQLELDLSLLSKGLYFLKMSTSKKQLLKKIILE